MKQKYLKYLLSVVFVVFLCGMGLCVIFLPDQEASALEGKTLGQMPRYLEYSQLFSGQLMKEIESYIGEQLPGRDFYLEFGADVKRLLGKKSINNVLLAKDGSYVTQTNMIREFESSAKKVEDVKESLEVCGIPFLFVVAGSKFNMYEEEELPFFRTGSNTRKATNDFLSLLESRGVDTLFLYDCLKELKDRGGVFPYYRTDHHWNCEGAFAAYTALAERLYERGMISSRPYGKDAYWLWSDSHKFYGSALRGIGGTRLWASDYDTVQQYLPKEGSYVFEYTGLEMREGGGEVFVFEDRFETEEKYNNYYTAISRGYAGEPVFHRTDQEDGPVLLVLGDSFSQSLLPVLIRNCRDIYLMDVRADEKSIHELAQSLDADGVVMLIANCEEDRFQKLNP